MNIMHRLYLRCVGLYGSVNKKCKLRRLQKNIIKSFCVQYIQMRLDRIDIQQWSKI